MSDRAIMFVPELQAQLDKFVPWCAFAYGLVMVVILSSPTVVAFAERTLPVTFRESLWSQFRSHEPIAWVCLICGGLWILTDVV